MSKKPIRHPSTQAAFKLAAEKWQRVKVEHQIAVDRMWAGALALNFTEYELTLLADYLSEHDRLLWKWSSH